MQNLQKRGISQQDHLLGLDPDLFLMNGPIFKDSGCWKLVLGQAEWLVVQFGQKTRIQELWSTILSESGPGSHTYFL